MTTPISEKTRTSLPLTMALSILASAITGTIAATASAYQFRDKIFDRLENSSARSVALMRKERDDELRLYVSKEAFNEWRLRSDRQFYTLLGEIQRLSAKAK